MRKPGSGQSASIKVDQPPVSRVLFHSFGGLSGRLATAVFGTLNILLLAVLLEPRDYGIYLLFIRAISLITLLGDLGQGQSAMAHFSLFAFLDKALHRSFARIVAIASLLTCAVTALVLTGTKHLLAPDLPPIVIWLLVALIPANIYANFWNGMMIGAGLIWSLNIVRIITGALFLIGTLILVMLLDLGLTGALLAYGVVSLMQVAAMVGVARFHSAGSRSARQSSARELLGFGLRSHPNAVFYLLWMSLPLFVLTAWYGPAAAGIFGLATQILDKLMLPAHALHEAVYKRMRLIGRLDAAREATVYAASIFLVAAVGGLLVAPLVYWIVPPLLGESYISIGAATALLLMGLPFASALLLLDPYFVNALQRPGLASWLSALQVAIVAGLSFLIIPTFGTVGAAASLALAQALGLGVALFALKRLAAAPWSALLPTLDNMAQSGWMSMRTITGRFGQRP